MKKLLLIVSLCLLLAPALTFASIDNNLYYGLQSNSDVKQLQEFLIDKGFLTGSSTGNFFSLTLKAVKAYQTSVGVSSTGYVGNLTRTAINNDLITQLSASNAGATTETGTTPPTPTPSATTNDVVATLQAQIKALQDQLTSMQQQNTTVQQLQQTVQQQSQTIQQIQQNTQQIAQNTTLPACSPNWHCGTWNTCSNSTQSRVCTDSNNCGTSTGKPAEGQFCFVACTSNWQCGSWNTCTNSQQTRTCTDSNSCGITIGKPSETQSCISLPTTAQQTQACQKEYDQSISFLGDGGVKSATDYYNSVVSQTYQAIENCGNTGTCFSSKRTSAQQQRGEAKAQLDSAVARYQTSLGSFKDSLQSCISGIVQNP
jgi:TolA-binding protein